MVAGQWIGTIGNNPQEGPHLHLEVRTYGDFGFDTTTNPLTFVNGWQYFTPAIQSNIDQNIVNRANDDGNAVKGYNDIYSAGTQRTQCFTSPVNAPPGAGTKMAGIIVYGYDSQGNPTYHAFVASSLAQPYTLIPPLATSWQSLCIP